MEGAGRGRQIFLLNRFFPKLYAKIRKLESTTDFLLRIHPFEAGRKSLLHKLKDVILKINES